MVPSLYCMFSFFTPCLFFSLWISVYACSTNVLVNKDGYLLQLRRIVVRESTIPTNLFFSSSYFSVPAFSRAMLLRCHCVQPGWAPSACPPARSSVGLQSVGIFRPVVSALSRLHVILPKRRENLYPPEYAVA